MDAGRLLDAMPPGAPSGPSQDARVRVLLRVRPLSGEERSAGAARVVVVPAHGQGSGAPATPGAAAVGEGEGGQSRVDELPVLPTRVTVMRPVGRARSGDSHSFTVDGVLDSEPSEDPGMPPGAGAEPAPSPPQSARRRIVASQAVVFEAAGMPLLRDAWRGVNSALLAYGMTGSGKTFSLLGPTPEAVPLLGAGGALGGMPGGVPTTTTLQGIVPRFLRRLLALVKETHARCGLDGGADANPLLHAHSVDQASSGRPRELHAVTVEVSFMEIYAEKMRDLLAPSLGPSEGEEEAAGKGKRSELRLREAPGVGVVVQGLSRHAITSFEEAAALLDDAAKARAVASTERNRASSRSHAVLTVHVSHQLLDTQTGRETRRTASARFVDLAGSESLKGGGAGDAASRGSVEGPSMAELATGARGKALSRRRETKAINRSLFTLAQCLSTLAEHARATAAAVQRGRPAPPAPFVPYRSSALSFLLRDCLQGNARTTLLAAVSPADRDFAATLSTLRYASSARHVTTRVAVNQHQPRRLAADL